MRWLRTTILLAISIPLLWSFGSTLTGARVFAYRDTANFYYPLYAWTSRCWSRGEIPLWNPQENLGTPVAAEATSAVFYPGQLVFALPLPYSLKFNLYLLAHEVLAALGAFLLARHLLTVRALASRDRRAGENRAGENRAGVASIATAQLRLLAAGLAGIGYAFSGAVLFQYCNVVFLVGAAWLPFALLAADNMFTSRRLAGAFTLGACLALMVLGGDPQMAYHTGLLAALLAWFRYRATVAHGRASPNHMRSGSRPRHHHALFLLAVAAMTGVMLSAIQVVPAVALTRASERTTLEHPASLAESLFGRPPSGTHAEQLYDFSVAPWRIAECLWPNISGHMFPVNQRWLSALRAEDRVWTPTLYLGLMPLLLALTTWRLRTHDGHVRWLSVVALGALIGSFGWYGLGSLAGEIERAWTGAPPTLAVGEPTGGLYWVMVKLLPGYGYFRYPAKLLVIASLATVLLGSLALESVVMAGRKQAQICRWLAVLGAGSIALGLAFLVCGFWWSDWFRGALPDELFGPLDAHGAWLGCMRATLHAAVLCGFFWWLLQRSSGAPVRLGQTILLMTAVELACANGSHVMTAPERVMRGPTVLDATNVAIQPSTTPNHQYRDQAREACTQRFYRPPRRRWVPPQWLKQSERGRGAETVSWDRATLFPKYHLFGPFGSVHSFNTMSSRKYRTLLRVALSKPAHPAVLNLLGVRYLVLPTDNDWPARLSTDGAMTNWDAMDWDATNWDNVRVWENRDALPRAWVVHQVESWPNEPPADQAALEAHFRYLLFPDNRQRDFRHWAIVDQQDTIQQDTPVTRAVRTDTTDETCRVVEQGVCRVSVDATLTRPGLLVLSNQYDPGWSVEVTTNRRTTRRHIACTNGVMQGVFLPPGQHHLVFRYAPRAFYLAASISIAGWASCIGFGVWWGTRNTD